MEHRSVVQNPCLKLMCFVRHIVLPSSVVECLSTMFSLGAETAEFCSCFRRISPVGFGEGRSTGHLVMGPPVGADHCDGVASARACHSCCDSLALWLRWWTDAVLMAELMRVEHHYRSWVAWPFQVWPSETTIYIHLHLWTCCQPGCNSSALWVSFNSSTQGLPGPSLPGTQASVPGTAGTKVSARNQHLGTMFFWCLMSFMWPHWLGHFCKCVAKVFGFTSDHATSLVRSALQHGVRMSKVRFLHVWCHIGRLADLFHKTHLTFTRKKTMKASRGVEIGHDIFTKMIKQHLPLQLWLLQSRMCRNKEEV